MAEFLELLSPSDLALTVSRIPEELRSGIFSTLPAEISADLVAELPDFQAADTLETLEAREAAGILDNLPSDDQADLIGDIGEIDDESAAAILAEMQPEEAEDARRLSSYATDVAGGLMVTEYLSFTDHFVVQDVIADLREHRERYYGFDIQYAYVTDALGVLRGVLRLRDLLLAPAREKIEELMIPEPLAVRDDTSLEDLRDLFEAHNFLGVPVVDECSRLVGIVERSAVDEAWSERAQDDYLKSQGIVGGEEIRSMPLLLRSRRRLAWLSVNILLNIMAASVIALFQDTLSAVIALAVFLPIISDMSGCSGNQAVAVSMRELSLGLVRPSEVLRVWMKEASVGLLNGIALGALVGLAAFIWQGNAYLGLVLGAALALNTIVAVSLGGVVPLLLKRFGLDPAVGSGPLLTTVTDMCGFFFVLGLATWALPYLQ